MDMRRRFGRGVSAAAWLLSAVIGVTVVAVAPVANAQPVAETSGTLDAGGLVPLLQKGGYILLIRHERTEVPARADDYSKPASDCMAQRNLSVAGYAGSQETGKALMALEIPVGTVLASPMCRGMDTARFMFGRAKPDDRLMHHDPAGSRTLQVAAADLKALIATLQPGASNIALVSHVANIWQAYGLSLAEGEIAVMQKQADGTVRIVGQAMGSDFGPYARIKLGPIPPVE
jgi:phosphohistidine phosphatase SixA